MNVEPLPEDRRDALEQQVRALLSVDPSPDFVARIRVGIADHANVGIWNGWRAAAGFAGMVTALVLVGVVLLNQEAAVTPPQGRTLDVQRERAITSAPHVEPGTPAPLPPSVTAEGRPLRRRRLTTAHAARAVAMSAKERQTLQAFLDGIRTRGMELSPVIVAEPQRVTAPEIADIAVAAIEIPPITIPALQESTQ